MKRKNWYKLDNVGTFYSFTNKNKVPAVFRYSVSLKKEINPAILTEALHQTLIYFPTFHCHLRKGLFWYYLESSDEEVNVTKETKPICSKIYKDEDDVLFRVNYYKKRINFEVSHILSDGRGSFSFFKCLIYKYLMIENDIDDIEIDSDASVNEKSEDSFDKYHTKEKIKLPKSKKIYQYKGKKKDTITYMEYHISSSKALALAHQYDTSLTSLLIAVLICSYQERMKKIEADKIIKIDIPVDLRKFFKSSTSRNFFGMTSVCYQFQPNDTFEDVIKSVNHQLKENVTEEQLKVRMNQMIALEKNLLIRIVPIFIKDIVLKIADRVSNASGTCSISNIGVITVDPRLEKYIDNFNVLMPTGALKLTTCSYQDDLSIGISSKYMSNDIIKDFCRFFSEHEIYGTMNINEVDSYEKMSKM